MPRQSKPSHHSNLIRRVRCRHVDILPLLMVISTLCVLTRPAFGFTFRRPLSMSTSSDTRTTSLDLQKGWFIPDNEFPDENVGEDGFVTREMLQRDLLADPFVKRKGQKRGRTGYKPLDNRDHLPFAIKQVTPDPYTNAEVKSNRQPANIKARRKSKSDLELQLMSSRLRLKQSEKDASTLLGEFQLDKSTTSGDIVCIADRTYRVQTARCQYKYAGGSRFVMVRKILEVKEINRAIQEEKLERQLQQKATNKDDDDMGEAVHEN